VRAIVSAAACFFALVSSLAIADTFSCTAVKRVAKLAYDGSRKVSVVGKDQECTFSIGGASVDSFEGFTDADTEFRDSNAIVNDYDAFIQHRFVELIREVAAMHGDRADFLSPLFDDYAPHPSRCDHSNPVYIDNLVVDCSRPQQVGFDEPGGQWRFESSAIVAEMVHLRYVLSIEDEWSDSFLYIFILAR